MRWTKAGAPIFRSLGEQALTPTQLGRGPAWRRDAKPRFANGELVGALTGQWPARKGADQRSTICALAAQDSIHAIQMVRAYRVIGHLEADLDPLKLSPTPAACRSSIPPSTASTPKTWTGRSSSTACWAWRPPRRAG